MLRFESGQVFNPLIVGYLEGYVVEIACLLKTRKTYCRILVFVLDFLSRFSSNRIYAAAATITKNINPKLNQMLKIRFSIFIRIAEECLGTLQNPHEPSPRLNTMDKNNTLRRNSLSIWELPQMSCQNLISDSMLWLQTDMFFSYQINHRLNASKCQNFGSRSD
jgi:hypothetical protein